MMLTTDQKKSFKPILLFLGVFSIISLAQAVLLYQTLIESQKFTPIYNAVMEQCPCWCPPKNNLQMPEDNFSCVGHFSPNDSIIYSPEFQVIKYNSDLCYGGRYDGNTDE